MSYRHCDDSSSMQDQHPSDGIASAAVAAVLPSSRRPSQRVARAPSEGVYAGSRTAEKEVAPAEQSWQRSGQFTL